MGIRGVTSNPTIFQKAIAGSADYDDQFRTLAGELTVEKAYWELVDRRRHRRPARSSGRSTTAAAAATASSPSRWRPALAHDTDGTIEAARSLHERIDRPNLMVKIPATAEGVAGHPPDDQRGPQHQRHPDLQPVPLRRGHRGLPVRARGAGRRAAATRRRCTAWRRSS